MKDSKKDRGFALVTGGSQGIGRSIAKALAAEGFDLLLAALPDDTLELTAGTLREEFKCAVHTIGVDMRNDGADLEIFRQVESLGVNITVLVNNAGFGHLGSFGLFGRDFYHGLMQVNMVNLTGLTRLMLDILQKAPQAYILNVGSMASFFPVPYKTVYASTKGYIYSFSRGLREELRSAGIKVSLLCPGPVNTNSHVIERIECAGRMGKMMALDPDRVGNKAVVKMLGGRFLILPGKAIKLAWIAKKLIPVALAEKLLAKGFRR